MDRRVIEKLLRTHTYDVLFARNRFHRAAVLRKSVRRLGAEKVVAIDLSREDEGMIHHLIEGVVGTIPTRVSV